MDNRYICRKMKRLLKVMYGVTGEEFFCFVDEDDYFIFGCTRNSVVYSNKVTRGVAIYLAVNSLEIEQNGNRNSKK